MRNCALTLFAGLLATPLVACTGDDPNSGSNRGPFRDMWRQEADLAFVHTGPDDTGTLVTQIGEITIGGREFNDNFANRGDVIVAFDGPPERILVEFRRFSTNTSNAAAELDFDAMSLWAFDTNVTNPSKPDDMEPDANCTTGGWLSGCGVRLYYDGQKQLGRAGADIRVTLPSDYRRTVNIVTEDADEDSDYLNRGNVCVTDSNGTIDVEMQSGEAFITVSSEATPAPVCGAGPNTKSMPSDSVQFCDDLVDDMQQPIAWSAEQCGCAMNGEYGVVKVESDDSASANITVDLPEGLWAAITVENRGDDPSLCTGTIDIPGLVLDEVVGNDFDWEAKGTINAPSDAVTPGAGYNVQARSGQCGPVSATENPDEFVGANNGPMQDSEQRGNVAVCTDCLRGRSCDDLLQ